MSNARWFFLNVTNNRNKKREAAGKPEADGDEKLALFCFLLGLSKFCAYVSESRPPTFIESRRR